MESSIVFIIFGDTVFFFFLKATQEWVKIKRILTEGANYKRKGQLRIIKR